MTVHQPRRTASRKATRTRIICVLTTYLGLLCMMRSASAFSRSYFGHKFLSIVKGDMPSDYRRIRRRRSFSTLLFSEKQGGQENENLDSKDMQFLHERIKEMRVEIWEEELKRPPNPDLNAQQFVSSLLKCLQNELFPDSGYLELLRSSTDEWKSALYKSVGAPSSADEVAVASALGEAMGRPNNQFAILVGEGEQFVPTFPTDPLDYADGTCWIECRLRAISDNSLLAATGWQLKQREVDGAWLVDGIDWQDFREEFRPGIGREEWMRICG